MYMPSLSYDDNVYAIHDSGTNFLGDFLRISTKLQNNESFDKAIYLLAIALNGISALKTPSAYCELLVKDKNCGKFLKCSSSCALVAAAIWRLLGLPNKELDSIDSYSIINTVVKEFPYSTGSNNNNKYAIFDLRDKHEEEIFSIGNVIGLALGQSSHYFTVASYPLRVVDHQPGHASYKYLFAGINGGGTHGKTSDCKWGYQKINTAKMEAYQTNETWMVRRLKNDGKEVWTRKLQFYYRTKDLLIDHGNRNPCQMPLGIGSGAITWQAVPYPPVGYVNEDLYFNPISGLFQNTLSNIGNTLLGGGGGNLFP